MQPIPGQVHDPFAPGKSRVLFDKQAITGPEFPQKQYLCPEFIWLMGSFTDKVIIITGATSGIGKALALQMAGSNVHLVLASRRLNELMMVQEACLQKGAMCSVFEVDMTDENSIRKFSVDLKNKVDRIDILINNAGISQRSLAEQTAVEVDRKIMEVNFFGPVNLTKSVWPLLLKSRHANIVLMSSVTGTFGFPLRSAYAASKHAIEGFFESWMLENTKPNIYFTTISPGRIQTNISLSALTADGSAHREMDNGLAKGINVDVCATKIINGILKNKRKIYVANNEMILVFLRKYIPGLFFRIAKKINPI